MLNKELQFSPNESHSLENNYCVRMTLKKPFYDQTNNLTLTHDYINLESYEDAKEIAKTLTFFRDLFCIDVVEIISTHVSRTGQTILDVK